jgi:spoIIIJ-associated protein
VVEDGVEFSGRTVDDAVAQAETQLGVERHDLEIEVVAQGSRGVFGIGAEQARIRARRRAAGAFTQVAEAPRREESAAQEAPSSHEDTAPAVETPPKRPDLATEATQVLQELLHSMGFKADVIVRNPQNPLTLAVTGQNLGVLIGRRGDNLAALQFMLNLILSKHRRQWPKVVVDVENYRARREESLRSLADRIAYRVRRNGRPFTLEAMPASDRRIIHLALRDRSDVETYSIGEGPARRVVVAPKREGRPAPTRDWS